MFSILDLQHRSEKAEEPEVAPAPASAAEPRIEEQLEISEESNAGMPAEPEEFEFVLGRRQIASWLFVATVVLMICVAAAYMAGRATSPKTTIAASTPTTPSVREPEPPPIVLNQEPVPEAPLFADPKSGSVYIQMGAVEKGVSVIFAEGLRKRGLPAFVAPGPSERIFRVLIGPLPDSAAYTKAKDTVNQIGLSTFARRFTN